MKKEGDAVIVFGSVNIYFLGECKKEYSNPLRKAKAIVFLDHNVTLLE